MPGEHGPVPAAGRGRLRVSHADRERVIETLKVAYVHGRLAKAEFDLRMSRTFGARAYADLAAVTADLPAAAGQIPPGQAGPPPGAVPVDGPARVPTALGAGAWVFVWLGLLLIPGSLVIQFFPLMPLGVFCVLVAAPVAGSWVLETWQDRRTAGRLPPRATPG